MWKPHPQRSCFGKKAVSGYEPWGDVWIDLNGFKRMAIHNEIHKMTGVEKVACYVNLQRSHNWRADPNVKTSREKPWSYLSQTV